MVEISLFLYTKPGEEIDLDKATPEDIKNLGENINEWLKRVSEIMKKLESNKWEKSGGLYDVNFYKKISEKEAKEELKKLGIKEDEVNIFEIEDEEDYEDMENEEE